jgi:cytoskeletal protein RodZ
MKKLLRLLVVSLLIFSCAEEDLSFARELAKERLSDAIQNTDSSSSNDNSSDSTDQQNTDSSSSNDNSSDSTDQQNTDSSSNKPEIGFAKLTFDKAIDSQIAKNCKPLEIDGLFFIMILSF